jgi:membrane protein YdbS with pleckstrin-like domain
VERRTSPWKKEIKEAWRTLWAVPLGLLLILSIQGCSSASVKKPKNEIWLIDEREVVLFRVISDTEEQAIPIKGNKTVKRFFCIDKDEFKDWVGEMQ